MQYFHAVEDIFHMDETGRWHKQTTPRGIKMAPTAEYGEGALEYMGDFDTFFWTAADYQYHHDYVCFQVLGERYIEIGENIGNGQQTVVHYVKKDEPNPVEPGLNCWVNFAKWNLFSRAPAGLRLTFTSLFIREAFFEAHGIALPEDFWQRAPQVLNPDVLYIPEVSTVLRQSGGKFFDMEPAALPAYLKAKAMEVAALLVDYVYSRKAGAVHTIDAETKAKVAKAQQIVERDLAAPPMVLHLAELVGLNKNKLQQGFRVCTGYSVGEYLRVRRMEKALAFLRAGHLTVAEIARKSGYQSPASFYNAFEKTFSVSPSAMRLLLAENKGNG